MSTLDSFIGWMINKAFEGSGLGAVEGGTRWDRLTAQMDLFDGTNPTLNTNLIHRLMVFIQTKYRAPIGRFGYVCGVMQLRTSEGSTNYAYAFYRADQVGVSQIPEYVAIAPTYDSRDGEYRAHFVRCAYIVEAYEKCAAEVEPFESAILAAIADKRAEVNYRIVPSEHAAALATENRIAIICLTMSLMKALYELKLGTMAPHTRADFVKIMSAFLEDHPHLGDLSAEYHSAPEDSPMRELISSVYGMLADSDRETSLMLGVKLVPLFLREVYAAGDPIMGAWRELMVTRAVSDLVINGICPAFPIYDAWSFVDAPGDIAGLFEGPAMKARYRASAIAAATVAQLREARSKLREDSLPIYGDEWSEPVAIEDVSAHVYEAIEYAHSFAVMSDTALVHVAEFVGHTLATQTARVLANTPRDWMDTAALTAPEYSGRTLFELAYGMLSLHSIGVVHGDMHGNNCTLYRVADVSREDVAHLRIAYALEDHESRVALFPWSGSFACIIDFSRAIIGPRFAFTTETGDPDPAFRRELFFRDQTTRVVRAVARYAESFARRNEEKLKAAALARFGELFAVLAYADFVGVGRTVRTILEGVAPRETLEAAAALERASLDALIDGLERIVSNEPVDVAAERRRQLDMVWGVVPPRNRWENAAAAVTDATRIAEAYSFGGYSDATGLNRRLRYSASRYSAFPPWAQVATLVPQLPPEITIEDLVGGPPAALYDSLKTSTRARAVAERVRAEQEALDGPGRTATSSWMTR